MVILLLFTAVFLLYGKSKYFPRVLRERFSWLQRNPQKVRFTGYALMLLALLRLTALYNVFTGMLLWLNALMLVFAVLVLALPLIYKN
ncbi:MAG: hypothetical protein AAGF89_13740 [Bacteroidota bacterium]